jgi:histidine triad (HIT) family protein
MFARSKIGRLLVGTVFAHMNTFLPVNRLYETDTLIAFYHPQPSYAVHILLVPKKAVARVIDLTEIDHEFLLDVFRTVQILVNKLSLAESGYRLILNGGAYQEVPQLHFHLVSDQEIVREGKQAKDSEMNRKRAGSSCLSQF